MRITIQITKEIGEFWASAEELNAMTDEQIINLLQEDVVELLDEARWRVIRG